MSDSSRQSLKSYGRLNPPSHVVLFTVLVANLVFALYYVAHHWNDSYTSSDSYFASKWYLVLSLVAFIPLFKLRSYPIKLQNRIIRLEERLRLHVLAPAEWHAQIHRLTEDQLIGLRFAPDDEVVELAKLALKDNLSRKQIEGRIKNWRPDESRI
jgi:hypothetical protein